MKTSKILAALFFVASAISFAACSDKEDEPQPQPQPQPQPVKIELDGTAWEGSVSNTYSFMGYTMNVDMFRSFDFSSQTQGIAFVEFNIVVPQYPESSYGDIYEDPFTYAISDDTITVIRPYNMIEKLVYNSADSTLFLVVPDEEDPEMGISLREVLGTDKIVLKRVH